MGKLNKKLYKLIVKMHTIDYMLSYYSSITDFKAKDSYNIGDFFSYFSSSTLYLIIKICGWIGKQFSKINDKPIARKEE